MSAQTKGKYPIDRPCSACSAGDYKMEYHDHTPPFREGFGPVPSGNQDEPKVYVYCRKCEHKEIGIVDSPCPNCGGNLEPDDVY